MLCCDTVMLSFTLKSYFSFESEVATKTNLSNCLCVATFVCACMCVCKLEVVEISLFCMQYNMITPSLL